MIDIPTEERDLLARRARHLAQPLGDGDSVDGHGTSSVLVVRLANERVGITLDHIMEVHRTSVLTPIPGARSPVIGVIAWRGRVLTVLDVASSRVGTVGLTEATRILVLGQRRASFGVVADDVEDVQQLNMQKASPVDDIARERRDFVRGVMADALVVLDAAALIARFAPTH